MVLEDQLSNETHFILAKYTYKAINIVHISMKQIFRLYGVPKIIISHRDEKFTVNF